MAPKPGVEGRRGVYLKKCKQKLLDRLFIPSGSDYINATWLHGHDKLKEFIITQHPTSLVKDDFWRMLWDHNAQTVVLLSPVEEPVCLNYI